MGRIHWYKRDVLAALSGMSVLTLEERGAYNTVLDLIYLHEGRLRDEITFIAGQIGCDARVWKRIRQRLIDLGKVQSIDGELHNMRADVELSYALAKVVATAQAGRSSGRIRRAQSSEINDLARTDVRTLHKIREDKKEREESNTPVEYATHAPAREAYRDEPADAGSACDLPMFPVDDETYPAGASRRPLAPNPEPEPRPEPEPLSFPLFWDTYPKKVGRRDALKAYRGAIKRARPTVILEGLEKARKRWKLESTEARFIPNPGTWLNQDRWQDEPGTPGPKVYTDWRYDPATMHIPG